MPHKKNTGASRYSAKLDPKVASFDPFAHPFAQDVWKSKYRLRDETLHDTFERVAKGVCGTKDDLWKSAHDAMANGLWMPGGRILAGAGVGRNVTMMNCYVNRALEDSMQSIMDGNKDCAVTLQAGGGMGTDFSTLRPKGAYVRGVGSKASGPLPFMDMFHATSDTVMSAGHRRGAMMGTLCDTHPDLPAFIEAKQEEGRLTNFNISVLVSDAFMEAVKEDEDWMLYFPVEPVEKRPPELTDLDFEDEEGRTQYVYSVWKARDLWWRITNNTYEWSEPGVIFIDRVNELNNLKYCETIRCTNPCGEQPLPPNGTCNLGAINLARLVKNPFLPGCEFNFDLLNELAALGVQFLDRVIEVTLYPLEAQRQEELHKRRLGLGVSGLADALAQLGLRYGSPAAAAMTDKIFYTLCQAAYAASSELASASGSFPLHNNQVISNDTFAAQRLDHAIVDMIKRQGLRNGVLLTVAPTGTTSVFYGDISSGIEPVFAHEGQRNVRLDGEKIELVKTESYIKRFYKHCTGHGDESERPNCMVTIDDLTVEEHITMQAAVQKWVDASVSKTVNCPKDITYEQFVKVYDLAYALGCKGCTTYRPSGVRGAVLLKAGEGKEAPIVLPTKLASRPDTLDGRTRKVKWPSLSAALYITVNYNGGRPWEVFFNSKDARLHDWMTTTSLMMTALLKKGGDVGFIADELSQVQSLHDTAFVKGPGDEHPKNYSSLIALIGAHLKELLTTRIHSDPLPLSPPKATTASRCPQCGGSTLEHREGCKTCTNCGYSDCG